MLVYVFWGSTYLGIAIGVKYVPPYLMTGVRFLIAGVLMLLYCWWTKRGIGVTCGQLCALGVIGCLLLSVSNVTLAWAEQVVPTGLAALIVAITPLWFLVIDSFMFRGDRPSAKGYVGLALGNRGDCRAALAKADGHYCIRTPAVFCCVGTDLRVVLLVPRIGAFEALAEGN